MPYTSLEICAGAGGQALGLEQAGFQHTALVELDPAAAQTLRRNRPDWHVIERDVRSFDARPYAGVDLFAGGVPCPPFSQAGRQLGAADERDLFPEAVRITRECRPRAVMLENVKGLLSPRFAAYRAQITENIEQLGYLVRWQLLQASDFGVPQLRPRLIMVALQPDAAVHFSWPQAQPQKITVGDALSDLMAARGWTGAASWQLGAQRVAPTLVGGSKKHGGADLGPTRAKAAWAALGVDGRSLADQAPAADFSGSPKLTVRMTARIQGFPDTWEITGKKTAAYRQVGNAFPPPVAQAVGRQIHQALQKADQAARQDKRDSQAAD